MVKKLHRVMLGAALITALVVSTGSEAIAQEMPTHNHTYTIPANNTDATVPEPANNTVFLTVVLLTALLP